MARMRRRFADRNEPVINNTAGRMRWNSQPEMRENNRLSSGIMNNGNAKNWLSKLTQLPRRIGGALKDEFFGGAKAAEINPQKVLASNWAKKPIDWEDIEPGWNLGAETDAWEALQNKDLGIDTWGDMYYALNNPNFDNWAMTGSPMAGSILEQGLGSYMDEGYFPNIQKSWSLGNVKPTAKNWEKRSWFDLDEGSFQNKGDYDRLIKEGWLKDPNKPFAFQDLYTNRPRLPKDITGSGYFNRGGEVGLEPGIASMMGYAKGGMVTKLKVPKGQGKWMKKFMNNMRDS